MACIVKKLSKNNIKYLVKEIVRLQFTPKTDYVKNILQLFEYTISYSGFLLDIATDKELPDVYAEVRPSEKVVMIRESVYNEAVRGDYDALFIMAHEFAHFLLHENAILCSSIKEYCKNTDPEWQADEFAKKMLSYYYKYRENAKKAS